MTVSAKGKGELGYFVKQSDGPTFVCDSGDAGLKAHKPKAPVFQGTITKFQGWDGATVFSLSRPLKYQSTRQPS